MVQFILIYFSLIVKQAIFCLCKSHSNPFLEPTSTKQLDGNGQRTFVKWVIMFLGGIVKNNIYLWCYVNLKMTKNCASPKIFNKNKEEIYSMFL